MIRGSGMGGGGKGGGGGEVRVAQEEPNSLQSKSLVRVIDVVSEGEIHGLVNGLQSIYFDETPIQNEDGTYNYEGVTVAQRFGLPDQSYVEGFADAESEVDVSTEIKQSIPVVKTITDPETNAVRIKIRVPRLSFQDTSNGDLKSYSVNLRAYQRSNGGSWKEVYFGKTYQGCSSPTPSTTSIIVNMQVLGSVPRWDARVKYKLTSSGTWLYSELRSFDDTVTSTTFTINNLPDGSYDIEADSSYLGTIQSVAALLPNPITISGKTTSPYERQYRIDLEGEAPWDIKLTRDTVDSNNSNIFNQTYWSSYTRIIDAKFTYPNVAYVGLQVDAQKFGNSIPRRAYEIKGIKVKVPSNYDPETREYTGIWDGTFNVEWTNNPAWILYDIMTNKRYGLGKNLPESQVDKFSFYDIATYCDEMVDDGYGNLEPRFTFNGVLNSREDAYKVLNTIASAFRGMIYWANGHVVIGQDSPANPIKLVTPANVVDGNFTYSSSSLKARHTVIKVTWNDPNDGYRAVPLMYEDPEGIERYGWRETDVVAIGCTSKAQAMRFGKWVLDSEKSEVEVVTYQAGLDHADVRPSDIIAIADPSYADTRFEGRVKEVGTDSLVFDKALTFTSGETYSIMYVLPDGSIATSEIINPVGTTDEVFLTSPIVVQPLIGAMFIITSSALEPRRFRVVSIRDMGNAVFEVTALFHDPNKYARVESDIHLDDINYSFFKTGRVTPPTNLSYKEYLYLAGATPKSAMTVSWTPSQDSRVLAYQVDIKYPSATSFESLATTSNTSIDILDTMNGRYEIRVRAVSNLGLKSEALTGIMDVSGLLAAPADVTGFGMNVVGNTAHFIWNSVTDLDLANYLIKYSPKTDGSATWSNAIPIISSSKSANGVSLPAQVGTYFIKAIDTSGSESVNAVSVQTSIVAVQGLNFVETLVENPLFIGQFDRTTKNELGVLLSGVDKMDDWADLDLVENFDVGEAGINSEGYYYFGNNLDLGAVYTSRITANVFAEGLNLTGKIDEWTDFDSVVNFDGVENGEWGVELQVRTTNDDPIDTNATWSDWNLFFVGDYSARAYEFRIKLISNRSGVTPLVKELSVQIDMEDRIDGENDITCPAAGLTVTFSKPFKVVPAVAITAENMQTGDYLTKSSISEDGFHVRFFNLSGTGVERKMDWLAKGYGIKN